MPNNMPYMQFYVNDFDNDTCGLSSLAVGVWVRLLIVMHRKRCGELSGTVDYLAKITRCSSDELVAALDEFEAENICDLKRECNGSETPSTRTGNEIVTIVCRRLKRDEIKRANTSERVRKYREKQANMNQSGNDCNADVTLHARVYSESESKSKENSIKDTPKESVFPFDAFWDAYGKKVERVKCERIYAKLTEAERLAIKNQLPDYVASTPDVKYRKNPQTYLNGKCWNDEIICDNSSKPQIAWGGNERNDEIPF